MPGDELVVSLGSDASTGFRWVLTTEPDAPVLTLIGSEHLGPDTELLGAPGQEVWTLLAVRVR
ncbi:MAG TPA: protease inhibitor I42 family protein [Actinomycetota bacterium]|nr:protease inhibitor I42 family protein [Actinomycetota bacterium]